MKIKHCFVFLFLFIFCYSPLKAQQTRVQKEKSDTSSSLFTVVNDENKVYSKPEVTASVDSIAWKKHLYKQLSQFLLQPSSANIPPGKYTVRVQFVIEKDRTLSDVKAMNNPGYGLAEAAINVVLKGPKWTAAQQGGRKYVHTVYSPYHFLSNPRAFLFTNFLHDQ